MQIGVIADTYSKMRPEALEVLKGSDLILHAGDVGRDEVLDALEAIAPVVAIRGNIDKTGRAATLPDAQDLEFLGHAFYMLHDVKTLDIDPQENRDRSILDGSKGIELASRIYWVLMCTQITNAAKGSDYARG